MVEVQRRRDRPDRVSTENGIHVSKIPKDMALRVHAFEKKRCFSTSQDPKPHQPPSDHDPNKAIQPQPKATCTSQSSPITSSHESDTHNPPIPSTSFP